MKMRSVSITIGLIAVPGIAAATVPDMAFVGEGRSDLVQVDQGNPTSWSVCCGRPDYVYGRAGDVQVPVDYDGDGRTDPAIFRPSYAGWFVDLDMDGGTDLRLVYGRAGDVPVPADYDGDGRGDVAVWRPSWGGWFIDTNRNGGTDIRATLGARGDVPVPRDYDGDGADDVAVFRAGRWLVDVDRDGIADLDVVYGRSGDVPMTGDFDGDGVADLAVYRPSWGGWYVDTDRDGRTDHVVPCIARGRDPRTAIPTTGDYDGDGRTDLGVFFPGAEWFVDTNLEEPNQGGNSVPACDQGSCRPVRTNGWTLDALAFFAPPSAEPPPEPVPAPEIVSTHDFSFEQTLVNQCTGEPTLISLRGRVVSRQTVENERYRYAIGSQLEGTATGADTGDQYRLVGNERAEFESDTADTEITLFNNARIVGNEPAYAGYDEQTITIGANGEIESVEHRFEFACE